MTTPPPADLMALINSDPVLMRKMAAAFKAAHDEHAAAYIAKVYAAGQREETNVIAGLRAALEELPSLSADELTQFWRDAYINARASWHHEERGLGCDDAIATANSEANFLEVSFRHECKSRDITLSSKSEASPSLSAQAVGDVSTLSALADEVTLNNATGNPELFLVSVARLLAGVRAATTPPQPADGGDRVGELVEADLAYDVALANLAFAEQHGESRSVIDSMHFAAATIKARREAALAKFQSAGGESK